MLKTDQGSAVEDPGVCLAAAAEAALAPVHLETGGPGLVPDPENQGLALDPGSPDQDPGSQDHALLVAVQVAADLAATPRANLALGQRV